MPARRRLIVVGGVAAGMSAASRARRMDPSLEILVFERTGFVSYGSCGLPYYLAGLVGRSEDLVVYSPAFFKERRDIDVFVGHEVTALDPSSRRVQVRGLADGEVREVAYDVLVLATGASAVRPPVPGVGRPGVFVLRTLEDGIAMRRHVDVLTGPDRTDGGRPRAVLVGAGPIGLEVAEALTARGLSVSLVEMAGQVLPGYHPDLAAHVEAELRRHGVDVHVNEALAAVEGAGDGGAATAVRTASGRTLPADLVLLATGIRPNVELARQAGLRLGSTGAVAVDHRLLTSDPHIYAAGDGVETWHRVLRRPAWIPLGTTSNKMGRIAGENAAGGDATFRGVVGTAALRIFDVEVGRTGLTEAEAAAEGWEPVTAYVRHGSRAHYYPGPGPVHLWLVGDRRSGRLLGAQAVGPAGAVAKRVDVLAVAVTAGMDVDEVAELDLSYAPPLAPVWDPILMAARAWGKAAGREQEPGSARAAGETARGA
ncbi:FAD-dependent oxidoreductase [Geochorda subterranea]|uniref:FAD-dependent oxidoreductase n=1 Tax=Geochorda subterranea TaxID=3109564 RepID=A0ABZ1BM74_9FIRM|nr:FAD-dependent oxidoreductase [Limnochorda sp. LNt]WRP13628.1 FAD-dependent oxidoreductase [Limnochorda sp. LNt]